MPFRPFWIQACVVAFAAIWLLVTSPSLGVPRKAKPGAAGAASSSAEPISEPSMGCPTYTPVRGAGRIRSSALVEASGLVASDKNPGVFWSHNDSGSGPRIFAITTQGDVLAIYTLVGANADDWEDLAIGPGPESGKRYLYIGDMGDNRARRESITIYRVEEPLLPSGPTPLTQTLRGVVGFELAYAENAAHDAEALIVDPKNADLYVITKRFVGAPVVYRAKLAIAPQTRGRLEAVATLSAIAGHSLLPALVTAADISRDGRLILVRTYFYAYLFQCAEGQPIAACFGNPPCQVPLKLETQGEAIAFAADNSGYLTTSEGRFATLHFFRRMP